jgi:hypothetical protein
MLFSVLTLHGSLHHSYIILTSDILNHSKTYVNKFDKELQPPTISRVGYAVVAEVAGRQVFMSTTRLEPPLLSPQV